MLSWEIAGTEVDRRHGVLNPRMSWTGGTSSETIAIDLPRPRSLDSRETPEFGRYAKRIRGMFEALGLLKGEP